MSLFRSFGCGFGQDLNYKGEHLEMFREHGLSWPARLSDYPNIKFDGLGTRSAELVILADKMFPPSLTDTGSEFFDSNSSAKRLLAQGPDGKIRNPWNFHRHIGVILN